MTDGQIDTSTERVPIHMRCRSCDRTLTPASQWTAARYHDCAAEAARESQGNTPDSAAPATLTDRR